MTRLMLAGTALLLLLVPSVGAHHTPGSCTPGNYVGTGGYYVVADRFHAQVVLYMETNGMPGLQRGYANDDCGTGVPADQGFGTNLLPE